MDRNRTTLARQLVPPVVRLELGQNPLSGLGRKRVRIVVISDLNFDICEPKYKARHACSATHLAVKSMSAPDVKNVSTNSTKEMPVTPN